jgi:hypothetical protein
MIDAHGGKLNALRAAAFVLSVCRTVAGQAERAGVQRASRHSVPRRG